MGKGGREREKNINVWLPLTCPLLVTWPEIQACALTVIKLVTFQVVGKHPTHRATPFRQGTFVRHFSESSGEILLWRTGSWDQEVQINMRMRITALEGLTGGGGKPRHTCLHVHNTAQRLVLWRKLIQDESLGRISVRGGAVWQVVREGLPREITFTTIPAAKGPRQREQLVQGRKEVGC